MQNGLLSVENDIAVLKVLGFINDVPINQLSTIRPHSILYGRNADVVGCGRGNNSFINVIHQTASLTILPHDECSEIITRLFDTYVEVPEKYICSVGHPYTYVNDGDSGAPFFYHQTLIGVTIGDCPTMNEFNPDKVNIHAGVAYYNCFIDDMLNNY
ncbi:PREDICTED: uncharacterized protein LOC105361393 [Ceratosolen solmsi marchali]|uniref:Uncharacterized protein LOC105361393 n=1 Tax=Ceratosolen solmsi marchali TaxID=326594 RepID=A0AAJ7DUG5_9HYME|nr:PREDICTED: uncharacterized protein LOC105361393 [Ceratosolen solmsi marchali]